MFGKKKKDKICDNCKIKLVDGESHRGYVWQSRNFTLSWKGWYKIPWVPWHFAFKKVKQNFCEECKIMNESGLYAVACPNCVAIIYLRYEDWTQHNIKVQRLPEDIKYMELTDDELKCPYCGCHVKCLVELRREIGGIKNE